MTASEDSILYFKPNHKDFFSSGNCSRCNGRKFSEARAVGFIGTNEYDSLFPISDAVIRNPAYKHNPTYRLTYEYHCLKCRHRYSIMKEHKGKPSKAIKSL